MPDTYSAQLNRKGKKKMMDLLAIAVSALIVYIVGLPIVKAIHNEIETERRNDRAE